MSEKPKLLLIGWSDEEVKKIKHNNWKLLEPIQVVAARNKTYAITKIGSELMSKGGNIEFIVFNKSAITRNNSRIKIIMRLFHKYSADYGLSISMISSSSDTIRRNMFLIDKLVQLDDWDTIIHLIKDNIDNK